MAGGGFFFLKGDWQSGIWLAFIGWFLLNAAQESVAQVAIRENASPASGPPML